ncbi:MAG: sigma-54-dependent transcriptional regulator [Polyangiales bacterium]
MTRTSTSTKAMANRPWSNQEATGRILVVGSAPASCTLLVDGLRQAGLPARGCQHSDEAWEWLRTEDFDALVIELDVDEGQGAALCSAARERYPNVVVVLVAEREDAAAVLQALRAGADDFFTVPVALDDLVHSLTEAMGRQRLRGHVRRLRQRGLHSARFEEMVGASTEMQQVYRVLEAAAETDVTVLITGESGTGKELAARALHNRSRRRAGAFVAINCAALPEALLESELFGHARGAFTDAKQQRAGLFVRATGGSILLDEIGEMPLGMQAKLLRVLQERVVRPVGQDHEVPFSARIVAATNRNLEDAVRAGRFRQDLFFRLNVIQVQLPALRHRGDDVLLIAQDILSRTAVAMGKDVHGLSTEAAQRLLTYAWPGNIRELHNVIERAVALTRYNQVTVADLPEHLAAHAAHGPASRSTSRATALPSLEEVERAHIHKVLQAAQGNRSMAARILGLDRKTLYRKLERWNAPESRR